MAKYYNYGLGTVDTSTVSTSSGDELARAANYIIPANVHYGDHTWTNLPISDRVDALLRYADQPQLKSPSITIVTPSGSVHYIYDSSNQVTIVGTASENNNADYSLAYAITGITTGSGSITKGADWSFLTPYLNFGNSIVRATITSVKGPTNYDTVTVSRTPTLSPIVTITTPTTAPTASTVYDNVDVGGTASDPNSLTIDSINYSATAPGATVYTQYFTHNTHWTCLSNCTWDGDSYNESGPGMNIRPVTGTWYVGFRPDYIRVTVDSSYTFILKDNAGATVVSLPVTPGVNTLPITWQGNDLGPSDSPSYLARISNASGNITNIEFGSAGVGTDESGTATGVANWTFNVPLIVGTTTVGVSGTNNWNLTGSDSIIVTRLATQSPIVTITTETTGSSAFSVPIEGTASDPNTGLSITHVDWVTTAMLRGEDWLQYFDNTKWQNAGDTGTFIWDGVKWTVSSGGENHSMEPIGTWSSGFRPWSIVLNGGPFVDDVVIKDTNGDTIGTAAPGYISGEEIDLTFGDYDIGKLTCENVDSNMVITNIRFVDSETTVIDSGTATGTTDWSFTTEITSAGKNEENIITVTAYDNYTPPLTGSDSTTITYVEPPTGPSNPGDFFYDEFSDGVIAPEWSIVAGSNWVEQNDRLEAYSIGYDWHRIEQTGFVLPYFDVWMKWQLSPGPTSGTTYLNSKFEDITTGHNIRIEPRFSVNSYLGTFAWWDGSNSDSKTVFPFSIVSHTVWFRYKFLDGDSRMSMYYAFSEPTVEGDWTLVVGNSDNSYPQLTSGNYRFWIEYSSSSAQTLYVWNLSLWQ